MDDRQVPGQLELELWPIEMGDTYAAWAASARADQEAWLAEDLRDLDRLRGA